MLSSARQWVLSGCGVSTDESWALVSWYWVYVLLHAGLHRNNVFAVAPTVLQVYLLVGIVQRGGRVVGTGPVGECRGKGWASADELQAQQGLALGRAGVLRNMCEGPWLQRRGGMLTDLINDEPDDVRARAPT